MGYYGSYNGGGWPVHVTVAEQRRRAEREIAKLRKKGRTIAPVAVGAGAIAKTFWGKSWCVNLERYSDQANRLPRGRSYLRSGAVIDLQITPGRVDAMVRGSELYEIGRAHV